MNPDILTEQDKKILQRRFLKEQLFTADDVARMRRMRRLVRQGVVNDEDDSADWSEVNEDSQA